MVAQAAVNRCVTGSSPVSGAIIKTDSSSKQKEAENPFFFKFLTTLNLQEYKINTPLFFRFYQFLI